MDDWNKKKQIQKSYKSQQTVKLNKWISVKKVEAFKAKNLKVSSRLFLTSNASKILIDLKQVFINASILSNFDLGRHIQIETNAFDLAIDGIFNQLISNNLRWWHPVVFLSWKMIPADICYKTHDAELFALVEVFKTWKHYLKDYKHEVLMLTNYNNLQHFIDTKKLSFKQVCWDQELSRYHFWIDYYYAEPMKLLMPYLDTLNRVLRKKTPSKPKKPRSCISYNLCWLECQGWKFWN